MFAQQTRSQSYRGAVGVCSTPLPVLRPDTAPPSSEPLLLSEPCQPPSPLTHCVPRWVVPSGCSPAAHQLLRVRAGQEPLPASPWALRVARRTERRFQSSGETWRHTVCARMCETGRQAGPGGAGAAASGALVCVWVWLFPGSSAACLGSFLPSLLIEQVPCTGLCGHWEHGHDPDRAPQADTAGDRSQRVGVGERHQWGMSPWPAWGWTLAWGQTSGTWSSHPS